MGVRGWLTRLGSLFRTSYGDRALEEELRLHAELLSEHLQIEGLSAEDAAREARRQLGGELRTKERYREQRGIPALEFFITDVRHSMRGLARAPAFTFVTVLTLGLGLSATTLVFSVVYGVLMRPLPYRDAGRLVSVVQLLTSQTGEPGRAGLENDQLRRWRDSTTTLTQLGFYGGGTALTVATSGGGVRLTGGVLSPALFDALGVAPLAGRVFRAEEELRGHERVMILSARTWSRYFSGDPQIVDHHVTVGGVPYRVVGIMPPEFTFPPVTSTSVGRDLSGRVDTAPEFWLPPDLTPVRTAPAQGFSMRPAMARLREGVSLEQATAEANTLLPPLPNGKRQTVELVSLQTETTREIRPTLVMFQGGVIFVLLIAAINVANLMVARATHRQRELAIRVALGAGSWQIARRVIAEALVLAAGGGALGWALTLLAYPILKSLPPGIIPRLADIRLDLPVLVFATAASVLLGLAIGLFVTVRLLRAKPWQWLREIAGSTAGSLSGPKSRPSNVLVVVEIASAMVLVSGAALLLNSFVRLTAVDPGFDPERLLTFRVGLPAQRYATWAQHQGFVSQLEAALQSAPGVEGIGIGTDLPFQATMIGMPVVVPNGPQTGEAAFRFVTAGFFRGLGVPVRRGREFSTDDRPGAEPVAIVNEAFAARYFSGTDPVGQTLTFNGLGPLRVVGVVGNTKSQRLNSDATAEITLPYFQQTTNSVGTRFVTGSLRASGDPAALIPAVRRAVTAIDETLAVYDVKTMDQMLGDSYAESRLYTATAAALAVVALILASIGLYGLLTYSVANRTREFGIRMALGADASRMIRTVVRQGLQVTGVGLVVGGAGALLTGRLLTTLLFGVEPGDPLTLLAVSALFAVAAIVACYVPARRVTRIDPVIALRAE